MAGSFFHENRQNANISAAKMDAQSAQRTAENAQETIRRLEKKLDSLVVINRALWSLVQEKAGVSEADLSERFQQVANQVSLRGTDQCGGCRRPIGKTHSKCMYCGAERVFESVFDML